MRPLVVLAAALTVTLSLAACGGSGSDSKPDSDTIGKVGVAYLGVPLECFKAQRGGAASDSALSGFVDTLIGAYGDFGADTKIAENGPPTTMTEILTKTRDTLRACEQAGASTAAGDLAARIETKLDE